MPAITALLHTENDALRLGRCLETLYPCDDVVIVDHGSRDGTVQIARTYGARIVAAESGDSPDRYVRFAIRPECPGWILCLDPRESLTEGLAASLFEWKSEPVHSTDRVPRSVLLREETTKGWLQDSIAQTRLIPLAWDRWSGSFPENDPSALALEGELLRFAFP